MVIPSSKTNSIDQYIVSDRVSCFWAAATTVTAALATINLCINAYSSPRTTYCMQVNTHTHGIGQNVFFFLKKNLERKKERGPMTIFLSIFVVPPKSLLISTYLKTFQRAN